MGCSVCCSAQPPSLFGCGACISRGRSGRVLAAIDVSYIRGQAWPGRLPSRELYSGCAGPLV